MKSSISLVMVTKNADRYLRKSLQSVRSLVSEIIIVDSGSTDATKTIASEYNAKIFELDMPISKMRSFGIQQAKNKWIFALDADEIVSPQLVKEIRKELAGKKPADGYFIPYKNHLFEKPLKYGGEQYRIMRFFQKNKTKVTHDLLHEKYIVCGEIKTFTHPIWHFSYQSIGQMIRKFTLYSQLGAKQKYLQGESVSFKKIFLYPLHMFYARFFEDKGYRDGLFRIPLDVGFAYMECMMYMLLAYYNLFKKK